MSDLSTALLQVLPFGVGLVAMLVVSRRRGLSWREDLRLVWPSAPTVVLWLAAWVAWIAAEEWLSGKLGIAPTERRYGLSGLVVAVKLVGMVLLAPLAEELAFRGLLFRAVERSRLGAKGAVVVTAVAFAAVHVQYFGPALAQVLVDGLVFGLARYQSRSVLLTASMHAIGNALAAYQRFLA